VHSGFAPNFCNLLKCAVFKLEVVLHSFVIIYQLPVMYIAVKIRWK